MNRPTLLFVHGWGFDPSFWDPLRDLLAEWPHAMADLGYFGSATWPQPADPVVGVGHSYGLFRLLQTQTQRYAALIAINGFARFTSCADFPHGTPSRIVQRMIARLSTDPVAVVDDFRARCHAGASESSPNVDRLACALREMRDGDLRATLTQSKHPFLALASEDDPIVTAATTRASFSSDRTQWFPQGGHLLPRANPVWCAAQIRTFLTTVTVSGKMHE
jgi:pimeloyl-[acyl-carrier protein] methyl ester esterase